MGNNINRKNRKKGIGTYIASLITSIVAIALLTLDLIYSYNTNSSSMTIIKYILLICPIISARNCIRDIIRIKKDNLKENI